MPVVTYPLSDYADLIASLDARADGLSKKAQDFIISLVEEPPRRLTQAQVDWLEDLERMYL